MKKIILAATSGMTLAAAMPALAAEVPQDAAVEAFDVEMSDERRALALAAVDAYWPQGNSEAMVTYMTGPFVDEMLYTPIGTLVERYDMMEAVAEVMDMVGAMEEMEAAMTGEESDEDEDTENKPAVEITPEQMMKGALAMFEDQRLVDILMGQDQHIEERIQIVRDVMREELPPIFARAEPKMRTAFAEMFARRFDDQELASLAAFADTPAGQKFAHEMWLMSFDPGYFKGMIAAAPAYVEGMPGVVKSLEERMAHLPPMLPESEADEEAGEDAEPTAEELIAEAEELEEAAAELLEEAAELRAQAAEL